jgi:hypothetical protein
MKKQHLACMALLCAIFWMGCSGGKSRYSTADSVSASQTERDDAPKLVKTADMHFRVKDVERSGQEIAALTAICNGMIMHHTSHSSVQKTEDVQLTNDSIRHITSYNTTADIVVRIPSELTEQFMNEVGKMAVYIDARNMDVQDKTLDYLSTKLKADNRINVVKDQKAGKVKLKDSTDLLLMKDDIVDRKIANMRTDADVKYSNIALSIYQSNTIAKDVITNDDPSAYRLPLASRIGIAFENGWLVLNEILVMLINLWPLFVTCLAGWLGYRYYVKRKQATTAQLP